MSIHRFHFPMIEDFFPDDTEWFTEKLQLSAGRLEFTSTLIDLQGVRLFWNSFGARLLLREIYSGNALVFAFVLQASNAPIYRGHEFGERYAIVWHKGQEQEYIAPTGTASLMIHVDPHLVDLMGWQLNELRGQEVPAAMLSCLANTCHRVKDAVLSAEAVNNPVSPSRLETFRNKVLGDLEPALTPWRIDRTSGPSAVLRGTSQFDLVKGASVLFSESHPEEQFDASELARTLGVSRRTLFDAFRRNYGIGPHRYLSLVRLHQLRERLIIATSDNDTVTHLAGELGFDHMSRLAGTYFKQFGEYPGETLRRS